MRPQVVYSIPSQKLIQPERLIESLEAELLFGIANVRMFNITNAGEGEILMDTVPGNFSG